jgi:hypothetical protein
MRQLPNQTIEYQGRLAILSRFEVLGTEDRLDVVAALDSYQVVAVESTAPAVQGIA